MTQSEKSNSKSPRKEGFRHIGFECQEDIVNVVRKSLHGINLSDFLRNIMESVAKQLIENGPFTHYKITFHEEAEFQAIQWRLLDLPEETLLKKAKKQLSEPKPESKFPREI